MRGNKTGKGYFKPGNQEAKKKRIPEDVKAMIHKATPQAIEFLIACMNNPKMRIDIRVKCAENLADRGLGKPNQPITADIKDRVILIRPAGEKEADEVGNKTQAVPG